MDASWRMGTVGLLGAATGLGAGSRRLITATSGYRRAGAPPRGRSPYAGRVEIRDATDEDWPEIYRFYSVIMAEGRTYAYPAGQSLEEARPWWMEESPGRTVVAVDDETIIGSAKMGPNRPGRGAHVATGSFLVDPGYRGRGAGR